MSRTPSAPEQAALIATAHALADAARRETLRLRDRVIGAHQRQRFLVGEDVASDLAHRRLGLAGEPLEEERDRYVERVGDIPQTRGGDAVHAGLVFLNLLELDANLVGQLLLRHADQPAPMTDAFAHVDIDRMFHVIALKPPGSFW